ncbi:MAG: glycosyltransferase, partial [Deltaproteobacteria bacterium]|nr:glycosyltransferase [Deltaproteobacteria bacterium]
DVPGYFFNVLALKRILQNVKPDILNSHYASGYGTLGRLSGFNPHLLSVWGSDVYDFPFRSLFKMKIIRQNLKSANMIASTSKAMAIQVYNICKDVSEIAITPFGVDIDQFKPEDQKNFNKDIITIGTIKKFSPEYGIDTLIRGFHLLREELNSKHYDYMGSKLRLLLVGGGRQEHEIKRLIKDLHLEAICYIQGSVYHDEVVDYLNKLDIYAAISRFESFGVAVLEASACCLPVVVSDVGGLPEVVLHGKTGFVVPRDNPKDTACKLKQLVLNAELRKKMGLAGRQHVIDHYSWNECVNILETLYKKVIINGERQT